MSEQALYRFFADDGTLLYVGISIHPFARMSQHKADKSWWGEVASVTIQRFPTRSAVEVAERMAIRSETPRYNVVHAVRPEPSKKARRMPVFCGWHPLVFQRDCPSCHRMESPAEVGEVGDSLLATYGCIKSCGHEWTHEFKKRDLLTRAARAPWLRLQASA